MAVALVIAGAGAAVAATVLPVLRFAIEGELDASLDRTGWDLHGPALVALALLALVALPGALRGVLGAAWAIAACGLVIVLVTAVADLPDVGDSGLIGGRLVEATARAGSGAYAEALAGVLLLLGGGVLVFAAREQ